MRCFESVSGLSSRVHPSFISLKLPFCSFVSGVLFDAVNATMRSSGVSRARYTSSMPPAPNGVVSEVKATLARDYSLAASHTGDDSECVLG